MNAGGDAENLAPSIGGLVDLAFAAYAARASVYLGLALLVFVAGCIVEYAVPAAKLGSAQGDIKLLVLEYTSLLADAYVIAAIAIGIGTRLAGSTPPPGRLIAAAAERWLPVIVVLMILQAVVDLTGSLSALGPLPDPPAIAFFTAPATWLLWAVLGLAAPIAALSTERPAFAVFGGITRAFAFSLRPANLLRLCIVAFVSIVPNLLQAVGYDVMISHHVARPVFWADVPIDALTVGPIAALQTVFALDFARRAGALGSLRR